MINLINHIRANKQILGPCSFLTCSINNLNLKNIKKITNKKFVIGNIILSFSKNGFKLDLVSSEERKRKLKKEILLDFLNKLKNKTDEDFLLEIIYKSNLNLNLVYKIINRVKNILTLNVLKKLVPILKAIKNYVLKRIFQSIKEWKKQFNLGLLKRQAIKLLIFKKIKEEKDFIKQHRERQVQFLVDTGIDVYQMFSKSELLKIVKGFTNINGKLHSMEVLKKKLEEKEKLTLAKLIDMKIKLETFSPSNKSLKSIQNLIRKTAKKNLEKIMCSCVYPKLKKLSNLKIFLEIVNESCKKNKVIGFEALKNHVLIKRIDKKFDGIIIDDYTSYIAALYRKNVRSNDWYTIVFYCGLRIMTLIAILISVFVSIQRVK